jgi:putative thioredoxin
MSGNDNPYSNSFGQMSATASFGDAPAPPAGGYIKDTTTATFTKDVIEESRSQPVLVDFWAPWCGPCKQLTPVIEKVVNESQGRVKLVKMNIDDHPSIAGQLGIQSIPAVIAFVGGRPADGFMGAVPESQIREFIDRVAGPRVPTRLPKSKLSSRKLMGFLPAATSMAQRSSTARSCRPIRKTPGRLPAWPNA